MEKTIVQVSDEYAELVNLIDMVNFHREYCNYTCNISFYRVKKTVERLATIVQPHEKAEVNKLIAATNWNAGW